MLEDLYVYQTPGHGYWIGSAREARAYDKTLFVGSEDECWEFLMKRKLV